MRLSIPELGDKLKAKIFTRNNANKTITNQTELISKGRKELESIYKHQENKAISAKDLSPGFPVEKQNIYNQYIDNLYERIIKNDANFLLSTHSGPDGDGLSASIVLANIIKTINPEAKVTMLIPDPVKSDRFNALKLAPEKGLMSYTDFKTFKQENIEDLLQNQENLTTITTDVPNLSLFANPQLESIIENSESILQIDEHGYGSKKFFENMDKMNYLHDPSALSSSHIVLKIAQELQKKTNKSLLTEDLLTMIYYGMSHDNQFIARNEAPRKDNPKHQLLISQREVLENKGANVNPADRNIFTVMTKASPKEQKVIDFVQNSENSNLIYLKNAVVQIDSITNDDINTLNQESQTEKLEKFNPDTDSYHWTEVKGITPHLAFNNKDKCDIQIFTTETDKKAIDKDGVEKNLYKISFRVIDENAAKDYNVAEFAKLIPEEENLVKDAGGHTKASGAYYIGNSVDEVISKILSRLEQEKHELTS